MKTKITFPKFIFIFIFFVVMGTSSKIYAEELYKKNILILDSNHDGYKISNNFILGTKFIFKKDEEVPDFILEHMDSKRFNGEEYFQSLKEMYLTKYKDKNIDLIVSIDEPAFEFLEKYHEEIFPNVPVVVTAVNYFDISRIEENDNFTGILQNIEIKPTIDMALELQPDTKKIRFIMDKTSINPYYKQLADDVMKSYEGQLQYSIFETSTLTELEEEFKALELEEGTIAFMFPTYFEDHGKYISWYYGIQTIFESSNVPVYSSWAMYLSKGIVGGKLSFAFFNASEASDLVKKALAGTPPSQLEIKESMTAKYNISYPALVEKFGFDISKIPENCTINGEPDTELHIEKKDLQEYFVVFIVLLILFIIYLLANIARRKSAEKGLRESDENLRTIINATPDFILLKDADGRWIEANDELLRMFDLREVQWKAKTNNQLSENNKEILKIDECDCDDSDNIEFCRTEYIYDRKNKEKRIFDLIKIPLLDKGEKRGLVILGHDITHLKRSEELARSIEEKKMFIKQMEESEKLRSNFFANISHELRTPINIITSALQYIDMVYDNGKMNENKDKIIRYRDSMYQNCYRLLRLINNVIDITKIDSGYFEIRKHNYNIVNVVEEITMSVFGLVESKGIKLIFDTDFEEKIIAIDPDMIERVVLNLLSNAVKFTNEGGTITVFMYDKGDKIDISVKDSGVGIPKEKFDSVFQRFVQVEETLERNKGGSGIGLSLVQSLVELHSGKIRVESEFKKGAEFIVELPILINEGEECSNISFVKELNTEKVNIEFSEI